MGDSVGNEARRGVHWRFSGEVRLRVTELVCLVRFYNPLEDLGWRYSS